MMITTDGIVIRERFVGENDKYVDVLTKEYGIIEISVKGAKKINSKSSCATQQFTFSKICYSAKGDRYFMNSCEPIKTFYNIRLDVYKYALATYFCEILKYSITTGEPHESVLRLFLNVLHFLSGDTRDIDMLKSIFELRIMTEIGLMPDLIGCNECKKYTDKVMYFNINKGIVLCSECFTDSEETNVIKINESVLHTLRYIVFTDYEKLFNFKISKKVQTIVSEITEKYMMAHLNRSFKTLEFYKSL